MKNLLVRKYGGTSVGSVPKIQHVSGLIEKAVLDGFRRVVVVSAMGGYTDELLQLAKALNPTPPEREMDMLVTTGERISTSLLSIALAARGIRSLSLTGSQSGILTDETHGNARIVEIKGDRIVSGLESVPVVIVAGFQGVSPVTKDITSLGRGGSDLSAVALAARLGARRCEIYTDVDGVLTFDPKYVSDAQLIKQIPWDVMSELAWAGAGVLHHRAALMAAHYRLPVEVRSTFKPELRGTLIQGDSLMESAQVTACTYKKSQCFMTISGPECSEGSGYRLHSAYLDWLWKKEESPLVSQFVSLDQRFQMSFLISESLADASEQMLRQWTGMGEGWTPLITKVKDCASLSLVGSGFRQHPGPAKAVSQVLERYCLFRDLQDRSLNFVISSDKLAEALSHVQKAIPQWSV